MGVSQLRPECLEFLYRVQQRVPLRRRKRQALLRSFIGEHHQPHNQKITQMLCGFHRRRRRSLIVGSTFLLGQYTVAGREQCVVNPRARIHDTYQRHFTYVSFISCSATPYLADIAALDYWEPTDVSRSCALSARAKAAAKRGAARLRQMSEIGSLASVAPDSLL